MVDEFSLTWIASVFTTIQELSRCKRVLKPPTLEENFELKRAMLRPNHYKREICYNPFSCEVRAPVRRYSIGASRIQRYKGAP